MSKAFANMQNMQNLQNMSNKMNELQNQMYQVQSLAQPPVGFGQVRAPFPGNALLNFPQDPSQAATPLSH
jgi:hypothetical protein